MPGDPLQHVQAGQRLEVPAAAYNAFADAARRVRGQFHEADRDSATLARQTGIVAVRNTTGFALPRFAVLALSEPIIGPQDNLGEFQTRVTFEGGTPFEPVAAGRFAVLLDPLDADAIGRGIVAGVTTVRLRVDPDRLYDFAELEPGHTQSLRNVPAGSARVLWLEESGSTVRWAVVRLVGVRTGAPFIQDGVTGVFVERLPPGAKCVKNDADEVALATFVEGIRRVQQTDRHLVRAAASEVFATARILDQVLEALGTARAS
ncbi:MAG: hypothetical protein U0804_19600 [Gemmataceae bacterium]